MDGAAVYSGDGDAGGDDAHRLVLGGGGSTVSITARGERMLIVLVGEPGCDLVIEALETGRRQGWLKLSMKTLVDLTRYFGVIDWASLTRMSQVADWAGESPEKSWVAYLIRNSEFGAIIRAVSALFGRTRHRAFTDRAEAVNWLTG
ncbi:MAG: hypothetical protein BGN85_00905 [Alphaproteobacteria bacterium 64-11]|nr:hypothetical protein [Alphaproteobacteria bacterium]OJU12384.1 MAG: hypothetical protein BGN85_00905 [Alphaproteobacteria bacterium 64-11]